MSARSFDQVPLEPFPAAEAFARLVVWPGRVVLASGSPRRRELLARAGLEIEVIPPRVDETAKEGEPPRAYAERLARAKAAAVAASRPRDLVIAADTIVVVDGDVLGKPSDEAEAASMLRRLSGRTHTVMTGVAVTRGGLVESDVEATEVRFRPLDDAEIAAYVASGEPLDKAGSYGAQGLGAFLLEGVSGCFYNVVGLPLVSTLRLIRRFRPGDGS